MAIVYLGKGAPRSPRENVGESKLLADEIPMLNPNVINWNSECHCFTY